MRLYLELQNGKKYDVTHPTAKDTYKEFKIMVKTLTDMGFPDVYEAKTELMKELVGANYENQT
jgi:hypothetical protein